MEKKSIKTKKQTPVKQAKSKEVTKPAVRRIKKVKAVESVAISAVGLHSLKIPHGAVTGKRILGRGPSSGHGKTSSRGSKGQTSRAGRHFYLGFEGGQTPLIRRMPKRGFTSKFKKEFQIVNLGDLKRVKETVINPQVLKECGLIKDKTKAVKILGQGEIATAVTIQAQAFSKQAQEKIKQAGGKSEIINGIIK